ncbi:MAG TPA: carbon-nitrogen family hydrolase [Gemmatimonadaceae bacterium]|nr:carbon-nitrogen family hydrolase [Gemmatimonadaceae bacterium]
MSDATQRALRVAVVQSDVRLGHIRANVDCTAAQVRAASSVGAELVLLPELWSTGYDLEHASALSHENRASVLPEIARLAQHHRLFIAGSLLLSDELGRVRNTLTVHGPDGSLIAEYAKVHLFGLMDEPHYLSAGDASVTFALPQCTAGAAICYDLRFPELFRLYALEGAHLVILPAEWPAVRVEHWRTLVRARAIENQLFIIACNRAGTSGSTEFAGHSMIVDPLGQPIVEGGEKEDLLFATLDFSRVTHARAQMDLLGDRRSDVYGTPAQLANRQ